MGEVEDELQLFLQGTIELTNSILSVPGKIVVAAHCDKEVDSLLLHVKNLTIATIIGCDSGCG